MEISHNWKVRKLVQKNDGSGLVIQVYYKVHSTDGEHYYVSAGNVELDTENIQNFISYSDLTEELVIEWVKEKLGSALGNHEEINTQWINSTKNPIPSPIKVEKLPWEPEPTSEPVPDSTPDPTLISDPEPTPEPVP